VVDVLISQAPSVEIRNRLPSNDEHISVFLPCAPNPDHGLLLLVPRRQDPRNRDERRRRRDPDHVLGVVQPGSDPQKKIQPWRRRECRAAASWRRMSHAAAGEGGVRL